MYGDGACGIVSSSTAAIAAAYLLFSLLVILKQHAHGIREAQCFFAGNRVVRKEGCI